MIAAPAASGPTTRRRPDPNAAYPSSAPIAAYRPISGGRPATPAKPMLSGAMTAASDSPAARSPGSWPGR